MRKFISVILLLLCYSISFANSDADLRKKIAQMLIIGFNGTEITKHNPIYKDIIDENISGVILFSKNVLTDIIDRKYTPKDMMTSPYQLKKLITKIKKISPSKLFICIDEEGGQISRLPASVGFNSGTLSHKQLGEKNDTKLTYNEANKIAETLNDLGINVNLAPCLDLAINKDSPVIYKKERSFSDDPQIVSKHAQAYIKAHNKYNILTVAKHFPGHGSAIADSHKGFTDISSTWNQTELKPYNYLNKNWLLSAVMVAHVYNKDMDKDYPATLSKKILNDILKKEIGFKGIIFSDDMQMKAITDNYSLEDSIIKAINAGIDVLIFGNNLKYDKDIAKKFNDIVFNAIKNGKISQDRIEDSYNKIIKIKSFLN